VVTRTWHDSRATTRAWSWCSRPRRR